MRIRELMASTARFPRPDAASDLAAGGGGDAWYAKDPAWADASKDPDFKTWVDNRKPKDAMAGLRGHYEAEKMVGSSVQPWKDGEDPTKWAGWDKLGVPKDAAGYKDKYKRPTMPEGMAWDENGEKAYLDHAAKVRIPAHIVQQNLDFIAQQRIAEHGQLQAANKAHVDALNAVYAGWGGKESAGYKTNMDVAQRGFRYLGLDDAAAGALETLLGGDKLMLKMFELGGKLKEGKMVDGEVVKGDEATLRSRLTALDEQFKTRSLTTEERKERNQIFGQLFPGQSNAA